MKKRDDMEDVSTWYAIACPTAGLRFDAATLAFLDADGDGRIRSCDVKAALAYVKEREGEKENTKDAKLIAYRGNLETFQRNFVTMDDLYGDATFSIFQTGILRIDGKALRLCFHVDNEEAHAALVDKSKCYVIYAKLTRPSEQAERTVCAVVTAGRTAGLYVGRNGVFYDRDGKDWDAVVTRVVEAQVSLVEAFWAPWRKLGESAADLVKKFLGDKQTAALAKVAAGVTTGTKGAEGGGAAMASGIAAIGIGIGMLGAAAASIVSAVKGLHPWWMIFVALAAIVLVVSLPSMVLAWFNLRKRDLGAVLNASGWAINRRMRFSMRKARAFTKCFN